MAQKQFKIGLSNADKQNMAQDVYERLLALTFPEYDASTQYSVGDFVVYNDQLYKCISATSGAWDSSKWQLATLNDLVADIEGAVAFVNDKANVDGNYPTMTVGAADNLTPYDEDSGVDQEQPFLLQGTGCGNGEQQVDTGALGLLKEKQGNSVVVNQLIPDSVMHVSYTLSEDKTNDGWGTTFARLTSVLNKIGHKVLAYIKTTDSSKVSIHWWNATSNFVEPNTTFATSKQFGAYELTNIIVGINGELAWRYYAGATAGTYEADIFLIDLTQMYGSNDNIPAHLLAHPENFFRYYQGSLAYNEGELVNANGRYIKCIGMNQWDEEVDSGHGLNDDGTREVTSGFMSNNYIPVIPNETYYLYLGGIDVYLKVAFFDAQNNFIKIVKLTYHNGSLIDVPSNATKMLFSVPGEHSGTTYNHDITISIYYEGESGYDQYYPYEELANNDTGTEILRSAGSVKDIKKQDGKITRRVGNRAYQSGDENDSSLITDGTTTNYPLAEPTTEQGTPYSENIAIDDFGSMDFGGTSGVPQGASIFYAVDYKAFIDSLYNTLDGDATDIVKDSELDSKLATLGYVKLTSVSGYDSTKTQVLKNVEGTLTWVTEE